MFFLHTLQLLSLEQPWTLILDDELANSFISPVTDDIKDDHQLTCKFPWLHPGVVLAQDWNKYSNIL